MLDDQLGDCFFVGGSDGFVSRDDIPPVITLYNAKVALV